MSDDTNTDKTQDTTQADATVVENPTESQVEEINEQTSDDMAAHSAIEDSSPTEANPEDQTISKPDLIETESVTPEPEAEVAIDPVISADTTEVTGEETAPEATPEEDPAVAQLIADSKETDDTADSTDEPSDTSNDNPLAKWYVVHTASGHENRVSAALKQRIESEHLENKILDVLVPTQDKIEIKSGKKATVKEKIFPGYLLVKMVLDDSSWLSVRTTPGVTSFVGIGNKPTPIPEHEVRTIVKFMTQGAAPTFKDVFMVNDTVKIVDGPFSEFIGKVDTVDKEKGKVRILVSIFGRETPVELDFLQVTKL